MAADRRTERKENMANHLNRFREILKLRGIQAALITSEVNQSWLCGFDFTDGYVLVTKEQAYVITDFRYAEAAKAKADRSFEVIVPDGMLAKIAALLKEHGENRMFFEEATLSVETLEKLKEKLPDVKLFSGASAIIDGLREIKWCVYKQQLCQRWCSYMFLVVAVTRRPSRRCCLCQCQR